MEAPCDCSDRHFPRQGHDWAEPRGRGLKSVDDVTWIVLPRLEMRWFCIAEARRGGQEFCVSPRTFSPLRVLGYTSEHDACTRDTSRWYVPIEVDVSEAQQVKTADYICLPDS